MPVILFHIYFENVTGHGNHPLGARILNFGCRYLLMVYVISYNRLQQRRLNRLEMRVLL